MQAIETERLSLRPFTMDDLEDMHRILDLQWAQEWALTIEERRIIMQYEIIGYRRNPPFGYRAVVLKDTGRVVGMFGFVPGLRSAAELALVKPTLQNVPSPFSSIEMELGYAFGRDYWGAGYATEAGKAMIEHAFSELRITRVLATTDRNNTRSIRLLHRLGMRTAQNPYSSWPGVIGLLENTLAGDSEQAKRADASNGHATA